MPLFLLIAWTNATIIDLELSCPTTIKYRTVIVIVTVIRHVEQVIQVIITGEVFLRWDICDTGHRWSSNFISLIRPRTFGFESMSLIYLPARDLADIYFKNNKCHHYLIDFKMFGRRGPDSSPLVGGIREGGGSNYRVGRIGLITFAVLCWILFWKYHSILKT